MEQVGEVVLAVLVEGSADGGRKLMDGYEKDFKCSEGERKKQNKTATPKPLARRKAAAA